MTRPIFRRSLWAMVCCLLGTLVLVQAAPEPAIVSRAWEFEFTHQTPQPIAIRDVDGKYHWFWYMSYKVVNHSGTDQMFIPEFTIATDTGAVVASGQNLPSSLFKAIKARLQNPLLLSPIEVLGKLLQGEDNAKESVAIWPAFDHDVDSISLFVSGLSGESTSIPHPQTGEPVLLRKTLKLDYAMPGTAASAQEQPMLPRGEEWVMR